MRRPTTAAIVDLMVHDIESMITLARRSSGVDLIGNPDEIETIRDDFVRTRRAVDAAAILVAKASRAFADEGAVLATCADVVEAALG